MVFAGESDDPGTLTALTGMGFARAAEVIGAVRGWHHGRYPAVRSARARELLTEVQPLLIEALAATADPDQAFFAFDRFLVGLPSGVQLFSLLRANPQLLRLLAEIMGTAPRLATILARRRRVLDAVLDPGFFGTLPDRETLTELVNREIADAASVEEAFDRARVVGSEQIFLIGIRVLSGTIDAAQAGSAYADLAATLIASLASKVEAELITAHGRIDGGAFAVIGMGKLGGREMTAASDLDLILIYDYAATAGSSDGPRPLSPGEYYTRFTQRLISALAAPTAEGRLYDVDMRLRPSGQKGPVAVQLSAFITYQANAAWTWEHLALTRARIVAGDQPLRARVEAAIRSALTKPRDPASVAHDVLEMRRLIEAEKGVGDIWDLRRVRGGLLDLEFIAQHLQLIHAATAPGVLDTSTVGALKRLRDHGCLEAVDADVLISAGNLYNTLTQVLRLCFEGPFDPSLAPDGLKRLLAQPSGLPSFDHLQAELQSTVVRVRTLFEQLVAPP